MWLSVQEMEQKSMHQRRNGQWLVAQTDKARERNWRLDFLIAQNAANRSELF